MELADGVGRQGTDGVDAAVTRRGDAGMLERDGTQVENQFKGGRLAAPPGAYEPEPGAARLLLTDAGGYRLQP